MINGWIVKVILRECRELNPGIFLFVQKSVYFVQ